jgi:hypothetical protein
MPLMSHEVRWFFPGELARFPELRSWVETARPFPTAGAVPPPAATDRLDGTPDVYVLVPGGADMGLKWREGQLQIKGRMARLGLQRFASRFYGLVESWAKWSYKGDDLERALYPWFAPGADAPWQTVAVRKMRIQRKVRLDARRRYVEVPLDAYPDRGLALELSDLEIDGQRYCSLAFEGFPNDTELVESFREVADAWLAELKAPGVVLAEHQSMGYPEFLSRRALTQVAV